MESTIKAPVKKDRRVMKTERAIKLALIDLMKKKDISEITISELAKKADINRKTFYAHYPNVGAAFAGIEDEMINTLRELLLKQKQNDYQQPAQVFMTLNNLINGNYEFYKSLTRLDSSITLVNKIKQLIKEVSLKDAVAKLQCPKEYQNLIMEFLVGGFVSLYVEWFYSDRTISVEALANTAGAMVREISGIIRKQNN